MPAGRSLVDTIDDELEEAIHDEGRDMRIFTFGSSKC